MGKIWGLDFGDVHKSIFAHDDTVTCVKWLPNTHCIFSTGKDGEVKLWDGDTFARIQREVAGQLWQGPGRAFVGKNAGSARAGGRAGDRERGGRRAGGRRTRCRAW